MEVAHRHFIPAAGQDWLLPLYDPFNWLLGANAVKAQLVDQASLQVGNRVLDIGCGTGALTLLIQQRHPDCEVSGLDPDPKALAIAKRKAVRAGATVAWEQGFSDRMPYADDSFDRVFSSLMFHHLQPAEKTATLAEVRRVLKPGGTLHLLDFGPPRGTLSRFIGHLFHHADHVRDNVEGKIPELLAAAGFADAGEVAHRSTLVGSMAFYRGRKPGAGSEG